MKLSATSQGRLVLNDDTIKHLHETIPPESWAWLAPGDLLVQRSNTAELVGTAAIFDGPPKTYIYPDLMMRLRFQDEATTRWVWRYMNSPLGRRFFNTMAAGAAGSMPKISGAKLKSMPIPLPPLPERRRIADILDKADAVRRKRKEAIALTEELLRSAFLEMFGDPVTNPKGWPTRGLGELADVNRGRFTPRPRNDPRYYGGPFPFIQTGDLSGTSGYLRTWKQTLNEDGCAVSRGFPRGAIAIAIAANIGDAAIVDYDFWCPDSVVGVVVRDAPVEYLEMHLRFQQASLEAGAPETAQKNINLEVLRPLRVMTPPQLQLDYYARLYRQCYALIKRYEAGLLESEALFRSLAHFAFRGELMRDTGSKFTQLDMFAKSVGMMG
ncbi:restriction endonuclease subunit S [Sorangium sp. So ce260]|uniref:restriction endonuclease subunit S n=1 Tax=Sorangium sp. So ce260 TaxID=3133291 RepID=UPI003F62134C